MQFEQRYISSNGEAVSEEAEDDFAGATVPAKSAEKSMPKGSGAPKAGQGDQGAASSGGGRGGAGASSGSRSSDPSAFFDRLDKDKDGSISEEELPSFLKDRLSGIDTDGDKAISKEEFSEGLKSMAK